MSQRGSYFGPILRPIGLAINKGGLAVWNPRALFAAGEQGAWYDPSDLSTLFQDAAGTTPVTAVGQPVGLMKDKSGRGNHASQSTTTARPPLQQLAGGRFYLSPDGVDDGLSLTGAMSASADFTVCFAARYNAQSGAHIVLANKGWGLTGKGYCVGIVDNAARVDIGDGTTRVVCSNGVVHNDGAWHVFTIQRAGGNLLVRVDGVQEISVAAAIDTTSTVSAKLFSDSAGSNRFGGDARDIVAVLRTVTASELGKLEKYIASKSGVTL